MIFNMNGVNYDTDTMRTDEEIRAIAETAGLKIQTGSYTGTNKYGSENKNTLTFNFVPQLVIVAIVSTYIVGPLVMVQGSGNASNGTTSSGVAIYISWSGNSVSWYSANASSYQMNSGTIKYNWLAIG